MGKTTERISRRVRIETPLDGITSRDVSVKNAVTGEHIPNVIRAVITLDVYGINRVELTYHEGDEKSIAVGPDGEPIVKTTISENPVVAVSAIEQNTEKDALLTLLKLSYDVLENQASTFMAGRIVREQIKSVLEDAHGRTN